MDPDWVPPDEPPPDPLPGGTGGGGFGRVLVWNANTGAYEPAEFAADTSQPKELVGPVNPTTLDAVVLAFGDRWTPTAEPA
jgi:hypothetical protein